MLNRAIRAKYGLWKKGRKRRPVSEASAEPVSGEDIRRISTRRARAGRPGLLYPLLASMASLRREIGVLSHPGIASTSLLRLGNFGVDHHQQFGPGRHSAGDL